MGAFGRVRRARQSREPPLEAHKDGGTVIVRDQGVVCPDMECAESNEFDDDQNLFPLGSAFVLSATLSRPLPKGFDVFFQGENLTNDEYFIARTPTPNLGQPIQARLGFRWHSRR